MLTLTFLGVGSAFAKRNLNSNALIEAWRSDPDHQKSPDDTLLIDFGITGPMALNALRQKPEYAYLDAKGGIHYPALRRIFVTHQHGDHIGGLEELAFMNVFSHPGGGDPHKPELISAASVLTSLWDHSLRGSLGARPGGYVQLDEYFSVRPLDPDDPSNNGFTLLDRYRCSVFRTDHIRIEHKYDWPSLGLFIEDVRTGESVFYSGDTRFDFATYSPMMERARRCFHEVQLADQIDPVHTLTGELRSLPAAIRERTWLYHYSDDWDNGAFDFVDAEFAGFAPPQRRLELLA